MKSIKKRIVTVMSVASGIREGDTVKLITSGGIIEGTIIREFSDNLSDNNKINAHLLELASSGVQQDETELDFIMLSNVKISHGNTVFHAESLVVFTDEIIGLFL